MPSDLERMLAASLHERAEAGSPVDPMPVLQSAVVQGQRIRLRRRVAGGMVVAALVAGASLFGVTAARRAGPAVGPQPSARATRYPRIGPPVVPANRAKLPTVPATGLVGSDPRVAHFSIDAIAADATMASWRLTPTYEQAYVRRNDYWAFVAVSRDPGVVAPQNLLRMVADLAVDPPVGVQVGGRPATLTVGHQTTARLRDLNPNPVWSLVWQPVDGLWATVQVMTPDLDQAIRIATEVRFDQARRCIVPFRVATPAGGKLTECSVTFATERIIPARVGSLTFRVGAGYLQVEGASLDGSAGAGSGSLRAGRYRVAEIQPGRLWDVAYRDLRFEAVAWQPYPRADALATLATVRLAARTKDLSTWD